MKNTIPRHVLRVAMIALVGLVLLGGSQTAYASGYRFMASAADYCGVGGIHYAGGGGGYNADGSPNYYWTFSANPLLSYGPGAYLAYSWTLGDQSGVIASGQYDSRTGLSTGGSYSSGGNFYAPRVPVGPVQNMYFDVYGSMYIPYAYGGAPCQQSFHASTYTTISGGGYFTFY